MKTVFNAIDDIKAWSPVHRTHDGVSLKVWAFFCAAEDNTDDLIVGGIADEIDNDQ